MSRKSQSRQNGYTPGKSLRRKVEVSSPENLRSASAFVLACITSGLGIYVKKNETTGSLRLKIYDQDETYEDTLGASEDWTMMLGEFAAELEFQELFEQFEKATRVRPAGAASEGREGAEGTRTLRGGPRGAVADAQPD